MPGKNDEVREAVMRPKPSDANRFPSEKELAAMLEDVDEPEYLEALKNSPYLRKLAEEALREYRAGKTEPFPT